MERRSRSVHPSCSGSLFDIVEKEEGEAWAAFSSLRIRFRGLARAGLGSGREMRGVLLATFSEGHIGSFREERVEHVTLVYFAE